LQAIFFSILTREWTSPGSFFAIYWTIAVVLPLVFAPEGYVISWLSILWINIFVFSLGMGSMMGSMMKVKRVDNVKEIIEQKFHNLHKYVILFTFLGFIGVFYLLRLYGKGINVFFSFETLIGSRR